LTGFAAAVKAYIFGFTPGVNIKNVKKIKKFQKLGFTPGVKPKICAFTSAAKPVKKIFF
jgi:hypothetical protein